MSTSILSTGSYGQPQIEDQSIDDQFQNLASQYYLSPSNPLTACLPSMLDLENECNSTLGLYQSSDGFTIDGPIDSLDNIARYFRPALSISFRNTSALEVCDYWNVIQMTDFQYAAIFAWYDCNLASPSSLNISASNFTQNCNATASYWDHYLDPSSFWYGDFLFSDLTNLLQASLLTQYMSVSYNTLEDFAISVANTGNLSALTTEIVDSLPLTKFFDVDL